MTRVYVPSSTALLRQLLVSGGLGPAPVRAHAVTDAVRTVLPDAGEEEWEYVALTSAAQDSLLLLAEDDRPSRVVVVAEAATVVPVDPEGSSQVDVGEALDLRRVVAVHVDSSDAADDVDAARRALRDTGGDEAAAAAAERCLDHELGWFATQEIGDLVGPPR